MADVRGARIRELLGDGHEIALVDVRDERLHATGHPLFAVSFPRQQLEARALERLPRRDVPVVVFGATAGEAHEAAATLAGLGFTDVGVLAGGLAGWVEGGGELFTDVNAPSKAFGELVDARAGTPSVAAAELRRLLADGADVVLVDARTFDEHRTMTVPGSRSVPGAELVARAPDYAPDPATTIVVHCAGRTRSIIGAQSLIDAGVPNRVVVLRDGTIGWTLAGFELALGDTAAVDLTGPPRPASRRRAADLAERAGVPTVTIDELADLLANGRRTVYRIDVRTRDEHVEGHPAGFAWVPGGQLVQETESFLPVRGAVVVLFDDDGARAHMTGSWLAQMGWDARVITTAPLVAGPHPSDTRGLPDVDWVTAAEVSDGVPAIVDVSTSTTYARGHVPGAVWATRRDLVEASELDDAVVVSEDGGVAAFAAAEATARRGARLRVLAGGTSAWRDAGGGVTTDARWWSTPVDVYVRPYVGTSVAPAAMQAYLDWEHGLVDQLGRDGTHRFRVLGAH